jgi:hypothetical protein
VINLKTAKGLGLEAPATSAACRRSYRIGMYPAVYESVRGTERTNRVVPTMSVLRW